MKRVTWEKIGDCSRCGATAEYDFKKEIGNLLTGITKIERNFCKECLLEVLDEQKLEKTKTKCRMNRIKRSYLND